MLVFFIFPPGWQVGVLHSPLQIHLMDCCYPLISSRSFGFRFHAVELVTCVACQVTFVWSLEWETSQNISFCWFVICIKFQVTFHCLTGSHLSIQYSIVFKQPHVLHIECDVLSLDGI